MTSNAPSTGAALCGTNISRSFRLAASSTRKASTLRVLTDASISIDPGEIVAVVGRSGVGKSTLLHILGGLDHPDTGSVTVGGVDLYRGSEGRRARERNRLLGFIFQFHHLLPEFSARENVMMPCRIGGLSSRDASVKATALLERVGLADRLEHRPGQLSGGEQQRVAIARAIVNEPLLLLADEPSGNLDPRTGDMIYDLLFELRESLGQTMLLSTHSMRLASRCDRVLELESGGLHPSDNFGPRAVAPSAEGS
jgi:lipoprotein-releasing system ATP-binding protein